MIVARVHECDPSAKPCRITASGAAYIRGYDGDFRLSALEEQAFLAARQPPMFDRKPVEGATRLISTVISSRPSCARRVTAIRRAWVVSVTIPSCSGVRA